VTENNQKKNRHKKKLETKKEKIVHANPYAQRFKRNSRDKKKRREYEQEKMK